MKLFISQPMTGYSNEEILKVRDKAYYDALNVLHRPESDVDLINSYIPQRDVDTINSKTPIWYLGQAISKMSDADVVYFCKGWKYSKGCRVEHVCANLYEIPIIEEEDKSPITQKELKSYYYIYY